ncbi:MAG: deoxycytidylate deaminase [bacterium]
MEHVEIIRPDWDTYFMEIATVVARRSTCLRRQVGAIVVKERRVLTTGYNGAPAGLVHCAQVGCVRQRRQIPSGERHELCRGLHAEQNAIIQAAVHGVSIRGGTLYSTAYPCSLCAKMLINAGIRRVVYQGNYPDDLAKAVLREGCVEVTRLGGETDAGKGDFVTQTRPT